MIRAFVAIDLPQSVCHQLALVQHLLPIPRPLPIENFHITLAFLGEQPEDLLAEVHAELDRIVSPPFALHLDGLGVFGGDKPRTVHATVAPAPLLDRLQARVLRAVSNAGLRPGSRRFMPHVTLGRYNPGEGNPVALAHAIGKIGAFSSVPFMVDRFVLYRSLLRRDHAVHDELAHYALSG